jgi:hypothetical protein
MSLFIRVKNIPFKKYFGRLTFSGLLAYPLGGFVASAIWCVDCGGSVAANIFGRMLVGIVGSFLSMITLGFPPANEGGTGTPLNTWPYILVCWLVIYLFSLRRSNTAMNSDSKKASKLP